MLTSGTDQSTPCINGLFIHPVMYVEKKWGYADSEKNFEIFRLLIISSAVVSAGFIYIDCIFCSLVVISFLIGSILSLIFNFDYFREGICQLSNKIYQTNIKKS